MITVNAFWFGYIIGTIVEFVLLLGVAFFLGKRKEDDKDDNFKK